MGVLGWILVVLFVWSECLSCVGLRPLVRGVRRWRLRRVPPCCRFTYVRGCSSCARHKRLSRLLGGDR